MSIKGAHAMSDSDSDATIEPEPYQNSPDLFESSDSEDEKSSVLSRKNTLLLNPKKVGVNKRHNEQSNKSIKKGDNERNKRNCDSSSLQKKVSIHEISDDEPETNMSSSKKKQHTSHKSDSDSETEQLKQKILNLKRISTKNSKSSMQKEKSNWKPTCEFGSKCYRKNPSHIAEFYHPAKESPSKRKLEVEDKGNGSHFKRQKTDNSPSTSRLKTNSRNSCDDDFLKTNQPYSFYLTKVTGIEDKYNNIGAVHIQDILSESMGNLVESCQFNYMFDIDWLIQQYPRPFRNKPLLIVHGEQRTSLANLQMDASRYSNVSLCQAKLEIMYGTHHTKMMLLLYENGLRVVITTANAIKGDWHQKTQGVWISPLFPKLPDEGGIDIGDSTSNFKKDLCQYITAYRHAKLKVWENHLKAHDMSSAKVFIIGSVPGRHTDRVKDIWGHLKLRKILHKHGPDTKTIKDWPIIGQFSSIGSLGPTVESWVSSELVKSLSASKGIMAPYDYCSKLQLIFPSVENIRMSLEGYGAGNSVPYSIETARKQKYIHQYFRQWKSDGRGRSVASPHIKTYLRPDPQFNKAAWFLVTSANLSKAAWGALEKNGSQLMIRSYEIGVLFLPEFFTGEETFPISSDINTFPSSTVFPLPFDLPPSTYNKGASLRTFENILSLSGPDIERTCKLSPSDVKALKQAVAEIIPKPSPYTALDLLKGNCSDDLKIKKLSLGCPVFDEFLRGGILSRGITEISGESASGKTQICLQLCLSVQLPVQYGGLNGGAVYICTEDVFPNKRLQQVMNSFQEKYSTILDKPVNFTDNIFIEHVADFEGLNVCIYKKLPKLLTHGLIQLVIVDSVGALFRCEYESHEMIQRAKHLSSFGAKLHSFSQQHNIPIVCVNQVTDSFDRSSTRKLLPALGLTWSNQLTTRFMLAKTSHPIQLENNEIVNTNVEASVRKFEVVFAPNIPQMVFPFIVDKIGVHAVK